MRFFTKVFNKGFTLVELMVVISVISLLASVVLSSLNSARGKGGDAAVKSNLANARSQAEIIFSDSGCYGDGTPITDTTCAAFAEGTCTFATANTLFANSIISSQIQAAVSAGGGSGRCVALSNGSAWAVSVPLKSVSTNAWCVDSTGTSEQVTAGDVGITVSATCN